MLGLVCATPKHRSESSDGERHRPQKIRHKPSTHYPLAALAHNPKEAVKTASLSMSGHQRQAPTKIKLNGDKSENKSTEKSAEKEKTLSESAAEYCENRNKKVEFGEVELITGEEEETNAFQMSAKVWIICFWANLDLFHKLHIPTSLCNLLAFLWDLDQL